MRGYRRKQSKQGQRGGWHTDSNCFECDNGMAVHADCLHNYGGSHSHTHRSNSISLMESGRAPDSEFFDSNSDL